MNVLYICDGKKDDCPKTYCQYNGTGECKHTMSESHAKYGIAEKITADRFAIFDDMAVEIDREEEEHDSKRLGGAFISDNYMRDVYLTCVAECIGFGTAHP